MDIHLLTRIIDRFKKGFFCLAKDKSLIYSSQLIFFSRLLCDKVVCLLKPCNMNLRSLSKLLLKDKVFVFKITSMKYVVLNYTLLCFE